MRHLIRIAKVASNSSVGVDYEVWRSRDRLFCQGLVLMAEQGVGVDHSTINR